MGEYAHPDALVETDWLAERLDDPAIRVIEVDEDTTAYEKGHIRNSLGWNWFEDLHATPRRDYVGRKGLRGLLREAGVGPGETVVLYGGNKKCELLAPAHLPQEQAQVGGHIPGAANVPWSRAANEDGTFKSADQLKELYGGAGVTPDEQVIAYCRIGERSAHTWFVLTQLLGYDDVENYDGSWTEYGSLVGVPVER